MLGRWGMANRPAPGLSISEFERLELQRLTRSSSVSAGLAQRARIVLLAGQGLSNTAIAARVGVSRPTVIAWRSRFVGRGLAGLACPASSRWQVFGLGEVGGLRVGVAEVDLDGAVGTAARSRTCLLYT